MVIHDSTRKSVPSVESSSKSLELSDLASPLDRIGALIIDLSIVIVPLFLLVSSPFRLIMIRSVLLENETEFALSTLAISVMGLILLVGYMTIMLSLVGATFGKMVFGIRVVNIWNGKNLTVGDAFFRSLFWALSLVFVMIPFVSVLSDPKRRPWHDRFANSIVLSTGASKSFSPNAYEKMFVQSILGSLVAFVLVGAMIVVPKVWDSLLHLKLLPFAKDSGAAICDEVDWALGNWPTAEKDQDEARLNVALTLFAAGEVSKSCLENEASAFIETSWSENPTAYLAQAFVHSDNPEISNQYLARVCEIASDSSSCKMSQIVEDWSDSRWENVEEHFSSFAQKTPLHVAVWAVRHFVKRREYRKAESFLAQVSLQSSLASFLSSQRIKILRGLRRSDELNAAAMTAIETLPTEARVNIAENMCDRHLKNDQCGRVQNRYCELIANEVEADAELLLSASRAILFVDSSLCHAGDKDFDQLMLRLPMEETRDYAKAMRLKQKGNRSKALTEVQRLKEMGDITPILKRRLQLEEVALTDSKDEYWSLLRSWKQAVPSEDWGHKGSELLRLAIRFSDFDSAAEVGRLLLDERFAEEPVAKGFLYSLVRLGKMQTAKVEFERYFGTAGGVHIDSDSRAPASQGSSYRSDSDRFFERLELEFRPQQEQEP